MPWWTDPDSLTPPVTTERLLDALTALFKQDLRQIGPGQWAAAVWHHPVRLSVHDDGALLHVESLYGAAVVTDADPLRAHIQATNAGHWLSSNRLVPIALQLPADTDAGARADLVLSYVLGRWARYAKGGFKRMPTENVSIQIGYFVS